ncbi:TPA: hypothetical protein ACOWQJ_001271 [Providencia rettgeri]
MKLDINEAIRDFLNFLKVYWKPSLAKYISVPLVVAGIGALSVPWWIDLINWGLMHQNFIPEYKVPFTEPNFILGFTLISIGIGVFIIDSWAKKNNIPEKQLKDLPDNVANEITARMKSSGFTAQHLQDEKAEKLLDEISSLRFFGVFPTVEKIRTLSESIIDGELSGGTSKVKSHVLALAAMYLCIEDELDRAKELLSIANSIFRTDETKIAEIFIKAASLNNINEALYLLEEKNYSIFFIVKLKIDGEKLALEWFDNAKISIEQLNNDGKIALLSTLVAMHQWDKALDLIHNLDDDTLSTSIALSQMSAFIFLGNSIKATELRNIIVGSIPLAADTFPLSDDASSIGFRKRAIKLFMKSAILSVNYGAKEVAEFSERYALWLELRGNDSHENAKIQLQSYFDDYTRKTLEYFPLAFYFGIDIDIDSIENEVNRQTALIHKDDPVLSLARFIIAHTKKPASAVVDYIAEHRKQMEVGVNPITIHMLEIEALARAGLIDDAEALLQKLQEECNHSDEIQNIRNIIESIKGKDPVALAISQYKASKNTSDLVHLVNILEKKKPSEQYYTYSRELFEKTGQTYDANRVCNASLSIGKTSETYQFLLENINLIRGNESLRIHWAWALFRKGDLGEAQKEVEILKSKGINNTVLNTLEVNLSVFSGDWDQLSIFIEDRWKNRNSLTSNELMQAVQLAKAISLKRTQQLIEFAVDKFNNDPDVLTSSYMTATTLGLDKYQKTAEWLNKAMSLSSEKGPLYKFSLDDLKDMVSANKSQSEKISEAYLNGDSPIFTIAELTNKAVSNFYLIQSLENKKAKDIRWKNLVPIYDISHTNEIITGNKIAIDLSSALVLSNVGILELLFDCFDEIVIPHAFMWWLFEEKQKIEYHQPSQIERAKYFQQLVSNNRVTIFHPKKINDPELAMNIGDELTFMLEKVYIESNNGSQALVVSSYPIYKIGEGFREIEADVSKYCECLISSSQLILKIKEMGIITESECKYALSYLNSHEKSWPKDIQIKDGAKLFIDSLSVTYLMTIDMLDKISDAGFEIYVLNDTYNKYKILINYETIITESALKIEHLRALFFSGISNGRIILSEMPSNRINTDLDENKSALIISEILESLNISDAILIDDRYICKHKKFSINERDVPIFTSLNFIETLFHKGIITIEQKFEYRTSLRELGFEFITITSEELEYHLEQADIVNCQLKPTKHLRLIEENLALIRINGLVKLPRDAQWLLKILRVISTVIKNLWSMDISIEICRARSCWLYKLMGYREWAQAHHVRTDEGIAYSGEVLEINSLLIAEKSLSRERKIAYNEWLDDFILEPLKDTDPTSFKSLVDSTKNQIRNIIDESKIKGMLNEKK